MHLPIRGLPFEVPKYNLTGDVLAYQRCGLQYRYYNRSSLPPSRPVQLWTGEFVHGVMEEAFLTWKQNQPSFPWPYNQTPWPPPPAPLKRAAYDIGQLGDQVEARLGATGKTPRSSIARNAAYGRVEAAINILAPNLFPLITSVEERLSNTRPMPSVVCPSGQTPRGDRYELTGRVDVMSSVSLAAHQPNPLVQMIYSRVPGLPEGFDVIVDYKAARRPPSISGQGQKPYWQHEAWQVQTYAWLRAQQPDSPPVGAGVLIYVNELSPSQAELNKLKHEITNGQTDVQPANGSSDYYALNTWQPGQPTPHFTTAYLLERAVRIVPVTPADIIQAVSEIDNVIRNIEVCALNENDTGVIPNNWAATGDDQECDACDFRRFCPSPASIRGTNKVTPPPTAPG